MSDAELAVALTDLGRLIAVPELSLAPRVRAEIEAVVAAKPIRPKARDVARPVVRLTRVTKLALAAAAVVIVAVVSTVTIEPARDAVARFFGIGTTSVEPVDTLPPAQSRGALPGTGDVRQLMSQLHDAGLMVPAAAIVGTPVAWEIDPAAETTVAYPDVVYSQHRGGAPIGKLSPRPSGAKFVEVGNDSGIWVPGEHVRQVDDRSFTSSSALVWLHDGVEYRLEGDLPLARMLRIARSLHPV